VSAEQVGVTIAVMCGGRVLIGERKGSHGAGLWALPGGHMEYGQEYVDAGVREVEEECGLRLDPATCSWVGITNDIMTAEHLHYITIFLVAAVTPEQAATVINAEPDKCAGWHWLTWEEVAAKPRFLPLQHFMEAGLHTRLPAS